LPCYLSTQDKRLYRKVSTFKLCETNSILIKHREKRNRGRTYRGAILESPQGNLGNKGLWQPQVHLRKTAVFIKPHEKKVNKGG
jgi:hypothetical protein